MDMDMDVVVGRQPYDPAAQGGGDDGADSTASSAAGLSSDLHSGNNTHSEGEHSKTDDNKDDNNDNSNNKESSSEAAGRDNKGEGETKRERKSRRKKERRRKERNSAGSLEERGERVSKTETIKNLEEENGQMKNELNDLQLRLVHLEAREHNKELKILHLQKELEETRSMLIEKEGDCVEWEQIDREKDKTVISLNQTIAILQRDLTMFLDKERDVEQVPKKKKQNIMFSPKPEEVFEYPREEDYDSDEELTSDEYDEYDDEEEREHDIGRVIEDSDDNNDEVVEKPVEESEDGSSSNPAPFLPFPVFSNLQSSNDPSPQAENPLVKLFSPTMPAMEFESPSDSPVPSPIVTHATPAIVSDSLLSKTHSPPPPAHPNPHKANGAAPPPSHPNGGARTASAPSSIKTDNLNGPPASISPSQISPRGQISPSSSYQALSDETSSERVSVKELRSLWENTPKTTSPPPRVTGK